MEEKFDQSAMLEWCETSLMEGIERFRKTEYTMSALGLIDDNEVDKACWFSLGFVAAFGFALAMFEDGKERDSFDTAVNLCVTFAHCYEEMRKEEEQDED